MSLLKLLKEVYDYDDIPESFIQRLTVDGDLDQHMMIQHQAHKINVLFVKLWQRLFGVSPSNLTYHEWLVENGIQPFGTASIAINNSIIENFINRLMILKLGLLTRINLNDFSKYANEVVGKLSDTEFIHNSLIEKLELRYNTTVRDKANIVMSYVDIMKSMKIQGTSTSHDTMVNPVTKYTLGALQEIVVNKYHQDLWLLSKDVYFQAKLMDHHCIVLYDIPQHFNIVKTVEHITKITGKYCIFIVIGAKATEAFQAFQAFPKSAWVCHIDEHTISSIPRIVPWCLVVSSSASPKEKTIGLALDKANNMYLDANITKCPNTHYYWKTQCQTGLSEFKKQQMTLFDQFVYDYYSKRKDAIMSQYYVPRNFQSSKAIVIIDNRANELSVRSTQFAILNTTDEWRVIVFTSQNNIEYYKSQLPNYTEIMTLPLLNQDVFDIDTYNDIMEDPQTWMVLKEKGIQHTLIIQDDGMLVRPGVDQFVTYDYIGAPWKDADENKEIKERISKNLVGNGGLSLRSVEWMLKVTTEHPIKETFYHNLVRMPEDVYFVKYMTKLGAKLPTAEQASYFSVEQVMNTKSIGFHKFWLYNTHKDTKGFFDAIIS